MDQQTNSQGASGKDGSKMKVGDKVWVMCEVDFVYTNTSRMDVKYGGFEFSPMLSDCKPVDPEAVERLNTVTFGIGDPVVSYDGRRGVVEAINVVDEFPVTVRHSKREQVSYKFGGVKHDGDPMGKDQVESDPINPSHYKRGSIECIEAIKSALGSGFVAYLWGNILKYIWRWPNKNGIEDLKKARWYLDRLIQEEEAK